MLIGKMQGDGTVMVSPPWLLTGARALVKF